MTADDRVDRIDTRIGSGFGGVSPTGTDRPWGCGGLVPGPQVPNGSVQPSPDTGHSRSNGYNPDMPIRGFSQLHVSGTGSRGKYGVLMLSPQQGPEVDETRHESPKSGEVARPHLYRVHLDRHAIGVEITATRRVALYRLTMPQSDDIRLRMDLGHNIPGDCHFKGGGGWLEAGSVEVDPATGTMTGQGRWYGGWGATGAIDAPPGWKPQPGRPEPRVEAFFCMEVSRAPAGTATWRDGEVHEGSTRVASAAAGQRIGAMLRYATTRDEQILAKIGVSLHSVERARRHLADEAPGWDFDAAAAACRRQWQEQLGRLEAVDGQGRWPGVFDRCLTASMIMPRERTGDHPDWPDGEAFWDDQYCVWDTFRTMFPLQALIRPEMLRQVIDSFFARRRHGGKVMDAFICGRELEQQFSRGRRYHGGMGGDMVDVVVADALVKDVPGIDAAAALDLLLFHADHLRGDPYRRGDAGWIPQDRAVNDNGDLLRHCTSFTIEMAYTDFCAAQVAARLGRREVAHRLLQRSRRWERHWNGDLEVDGFRGWLSARRSDGSWADEAALTNNDAFAEGTTWDYFHFVPHDVARVIALCGGPDDYARRVLFALDHGRIDWGHIQNEPVFLLIHTLNYALRPDLTSRCVRRQMAEYTPFALAGPDDSGAMSSWYIWVCLGLMPNAGQDVYLLHGPRWPRARLKLARGASLEILGEGAGEAACYVARAWLNDRPLTRCWLRHGEIAGGGTLRFEMTAAPTDWGTSEPPPSGVDGLEQLLA